MSTAPPDDALAALLSDYLRYLEVEKQASPNTVSAVRREGGLFLDYCRSAGLATPGDISVHQVRSFITRKNREGRQPPTLRRYLSVIRGLFRYAVKTGSASHNPATGVRGPKGQRVLPKVVDSEDLNLALDRAPGAADGAMAIRDHAIVELFYSAGLRLSELHDLDLPRGAGPFPDELRVIGKGRKERIVPVGRKARGALDTWLRERAAVAAIDETALFTGARGRRLSRAGIGTALKAWAQRVQLPAHLHPHKLRHSFATHLLNESGDLRAVQELLGHANLSTTQIYTQMEWSRLAKVYDAAHPRARREPSRDSDLSRSEIAARGIAPDKIEGSTAFARERKVGG